MFIVNRVRIDMSSIDGTNFAGQQCFHIELFSRPAHKTGRFFQNNLRFLMFER